MRTIKFRGKRVDNGEWVYGDLLHTTSVLNGTKTHHVLIGVDLELYEVHPETIGQFTGLHDKDGNEIYESCELNEDYLVVYKFNRYVLQNISNRDIFVEINEHEEYKITREYVPLA